MFPRVVLCVLVCLCAGCVYAQTPDILTFNDGEQLAGKLISVLGGKVTFHSDVLGNVTVPLAKVKTLHAARPFAVIEKDPHITRKTAGARVPVGTITLENQSLQVSQRSFPIEQVGVVIDSDTFHREVRGEGDFLYGWTGAITLGATLVNATNSAQTYLGSVGLVRAIPTIASVPPLSKTTLNLSGSYGLAKSAEIISAGAVYQAPSISKTDILHGDTEYDRYLSHSVFGLVNASADHNFGNGLELQQAYGAGMGWSPLQAPRNSFDVKAGLQYEQQQFYNGLISGLGTPSINLVGAFLNESWARTVAHGIRFNEYVTLTPTFNILQAYSAVGSASFVFPVYRKLNFTTATTDNYLGDPPQGFHRNTFQFTSGVTYVIK